ncbi:asparagine--tRNA ligase SLM5 [Lachancea thermotolerans CBS 6340]|uniref:Asparagine--tRNA ligase, mitochondrial n=1 Tax=Lachancea thermotolerans (strain ATCC 56472 / CBS 6340 / NRRL Y-8284) TaxID=559295 RepID=C5E3J5_LACTC|nr:KLTH0H14080p [Lachancea thermotolerans CBS 6340]CAR30606.1 KLTH0H14080p [Lachancea thermotolerans CBS 6340]
MPGLPPTFKSLFRNASNPPAKVELLCGWIKSVRLLKKLAFIDLQDGTTPNPLKLVVRRSEDGSDMLKQLRTGQSLMVKDALWKATPSRLQPFELETDASPECLQVLGQVPASYPLQKKHHSLAFLRSNPTLKHRSNYLGSLLRFRSCVESSLTQFFDSQDFTKVSPPVLTSGDCEGAGELFRAESNAHIARKTSYFGRPTYLTVSTQLHLEVLAMALNRVWTLTPCFRAEESDTNRHLAEFWMLETELCYVQNVKGLTKVAEHMLKHVVESCLAQKLSLLPSVVPQENAESPESIVARWESLLHSEWPRVTYTSAIELLKRQHSVSQFSFEPQWGKDLQSEHEKWLAAHYNSPVFITDYPRNCKPFYMKQNFDAADTVACFDLIVPQMGEIIGGSIREDNYDTLIQEMDRRGMKSEDLDWYTSLRLNGGAPHGGFGLGLERFVSWLFGAQNIRDAIPFYRSAGGTINM